MAVKKSVTESVMEYVFSFRLVTFQEFIMNGTEAARDEVCFQLQDVTESVFDKVHATTSSEVFYDGGIFLASLFDGV